MLLEFVAPPSRCCSPTSCRCYCVCLMQVAWPGGSAQPPATPKPATAADPELAAREEQLKKARN